MVFTSISLPQFGPNGLPVFPQEPLPDPDPDPDPVPLPDPDPVPFPDPDPVSGRPSVFGRAPARLTE
jgi:hypothetical protein